MKSVHVAVYILLTFLLASNFSHAQTRGRADGYLTDSNGNIVRSNTGDCFHTSSWNLEKATIEGCDGVVLKAKATIIKGAPTGAITNVVIPSAALFAFDKSVLTKEGKEKISEIRKSLLPDIAKAHRVIIIGHTDSTGQADYNQELSLRRAEAVRDYLISTQAPAENLKVLGRGQNEPVSSNDTREGKRLNRRVEIVVIAELRELDAIRFPSVALFPRRSAELTSEGQQMIQQTGTQVREQFQRASYIEVVGHTDDVGDDAYNQRLSEQRAMNVREFIIGMGVEYSKIVAIGEGEKRPIASNHSPEGRTQNRRVEVRMLGRLK